MRLTATVNTDASFCHQSKAAGWAVWIAVDGGVKLKHSGQFKDAPKSSGQAEFWAMLNGLWIAAQYGVTHALIQGDCQGALAKIDKAGTEVAAIRASVVQTISIRTKWVKAHSHTKDARHFVNDWCDGMAKRHMRQGRHVFNKQTKRKNRLEK